MDLKGHTSLKWWKDVVKVSCDNEDGRNFKKKITQNLYQLELTSHHHPHLRARSLSSPDFMKATGGGGGEFDFGDDEDDDDDEADAAARAGDLENELVLQVRGISNYIGLGCVSRLQGSTPLGTISFVTSDRLTKCI